jgi:hypothetical protein
MWSQTLSSNSLDLTEHCTKRYCLMGKTFRTFLWLWENAWHDVSRQCPENHPPIQSQKSTTAFVLFRRPRPLLPCSSHHVLFVPECNVAISTFTAILFAIATNETANTDATWLTSPYVGDAPLLRFPVLSLCDKVPRPLQIFRRTAEFFSLLCSNYPECKHTRFWGSHLPPVTFTNHDLLIAPPVEFLCVFICISTLWEPNLKQLRVKNRQPITYPKRLLGRC